MQRVNMYDFYQLGAALQPLGNISAESKLEDAWWHLFEASNRLRSLVSSKILRVAYARPAAPELVTVLTHILQPILHRRHPQWVEGYV